MKIKFFCTVLIIFLLFECDIFRQNTVVDVISDDAGTIDFLHNLNELCPKILFVYRSGNIDEEIERIKVLLDSLKSNPDFTSELKKYLKDVEKAKNRINSMQDVLGFNYLVTEKATTLGIKPTCPCPGGDSSHCVCTLDKIAIYDKKNSASSEKGTEIEVMSINSKKVSIDKSEYYNLIHTRTFLLQETEHIYSGDTLKITFSSPGADNPKKRDKIEIREVMNVYY